MTADRKKKVLIIYNRIWPYRLRIFELLNEKFDLTVSYTDKSFKGKDYKFKTVYLDGYTIGPFFWHRESLHKFAKHFDVVIGLYDIRWLRVMLLALIMFKKYKVLFWGIGVTASYHNRFDSKRTWDFIRYLFGRKSDGVILYSNYPIERHLEYGINESKIFVAHNTVEVDFSEIEYDREIKNDILFVGTLYAEKKVDQLLRAFQVVQQSSVCLPELHIVGDGPERKKLENLCEDLGISSKVIFHGAVYDKSLLRERFNRALLCVSPDQAGLSVLTSMGMSTAFLTSKEAITGGEIISLIESGTDLFYDGSLDGLVEKLEWAMDNRELVRELGERGREFYQKHRTPEQMACAIIQAVESALNTESVQ